MHLCAYSGLADSTQTAADSLPTRHTHSSALWCALMIYPPRRYIQFQYTQPSYLLPTQTHAQQILNMPKALYLWMLLVHLQRELFWGRATSHQSRHQSWNSHSCKIFHQTPALLGKNGPISYTTEIKNFQWENLERKNKNDKNWVSGFPFGVKGSNHKWESD